MGVGRVRSGGWEGEVGGLGGRGRGIGREMDGSGRSVLYTSAKLTTESECAPVVCAHDCLGGHRCGYMYKSWHTNHWLVQLWTVQSLLT